jgi:hypothetical protein
VAEGDETFTVSIASPTGDARIGGPASATVTIPSSSPPQTTIDRAPRPRTVARKATLRFSSSEPGSSFECSLDGRSWKPCTSPRRLTRLTVGAHRFRVRATNPAGDQDRTPAAHSWRVTAG